MVILFFLKSSSFTTRAFSLIAFNRQEKEQQLLKHCSQFVLVSSPCDPRSVGKTQFSGSKEPCSLSPSLCGLDPLVKSLNIDILVVASYKPR